MTDTTQTPSSIAPVDHTQPGTGSAGSAGSDASGTAPTTFEADPLVTDDMRNLDEFLGQTFSEPEPAPEDSPDVSAATTSPAAEGGGEGTQPSPEPSAPAPPPTPSAATPGANAEEAAPTEAPATAQPQISEAELAAMFLGTPTASQVTPPSPPQAGQTEAAPAAEQEFRPFNEDMVLPRDLTSAIFDSEDPDSRDRAFSRLIATVANAVAAKAVGHVQTELAPQFRQQLYADMEAQSGLANFAAGVVREAPELASPTYGPLIARAIQVVGQQMSRDAPVDEAFVKRVATLARAAKAQMFGQAAAPAPVATPARSNGAKPPAPYLTGQSGSGARPVGTGAPEDPNSPGAMYEEMNAF